MKLYRMLRHRILLGFVLLISGCAGSSQYMKIAPTGHEPAAPAANEAVVYFLRPSGLGFAVNSSVFDLADNDEGFVGIVSAKKKVAYRTSPGEHNFMVVGETADFMAASLQAGKTYYALVEPRMGAWKARFSLRPVMKSELDSKEFKEWLAACELTENTPESLAWAKQNAKSISAKRAASWKRWMEKAEADRPRLKADDAL